MSNGALCSLALVLGGLLIAPEVSAQPPGPPPQQQPYPQQPYPQQQPPAGYYQPAAPGYPLTPPGFHQHDGFFFRLQLGGGYNSMSASDIDASIKGGGGAFNLAIGGAVSPGLIIFGELHDSVAVDPTVEAGGFSGTANGNAGIVGVGIGLAYYLPSNLFFAGTLSGQKMSLQDSDGTEVAETEFGAGVKAQIGQEWWVSADWGLGVAAQVSFGSMKDKDDGFGNAPTWTATSFNLLFSATYN